MVGHAASVPCDSGAPAWRPVVVDFLKQDACRVPAPGAGIRCPSHRDVLRDARGRLARAQPSRRSITRWGPALPLKSSRPLSSKPALR